MANPPRGACWVAMTGMSIIMAALIIFSAVASTDGYECTTSRNRSCKSHMKKAVCVNESRVSASSHVARPGSSGSWLLTHPARYEPVDARHGVR